MHSNSSENRFGQLASPYTERTHEWSEQASLADILRRRLALKNRTAGERMRDLAWQAVDMSYELRDKAADLFRRSLQSVDKYGRIAVLGVVLAGAFSEQGDRPLREIIQDHEIARSLPTDEKVFSQEVDGQKVFGHSDKLTETTLAYLAGRGVMPAYLEDLLLREELAAVYYKQPEDKKYVPSDLEGCPIEKLETAHLSVLYNKDYASVPEVERAEKVDEFAANLSEDYDAAVESSIWELEQYAGAPRVRFFINTPYFDAYKSGKEPTPEYLKEYYMRRSHYNPQTNTIYIDHVDILQMRKDAISEFAHAFERQDNPVQAVKNVREDHKLAAAIGKRQGISENKAYDAIAYRKDLHAGPLHEWHAHHVTENYLKERFGQIISRTRGAQSSASK